MARSYAVLHAALADKAKWMDTSWSTRAAWVTLYLRSIASEGYFDSREQAEKILRREGCRASARAIDELTERRLVDQVDDGRLYMHDWHDWQPKYRGQSDDPVVKALREQVRYWKTKAEDGAEGNAGDEPATNLRQPVIEESRGEEEKSSPPSGARTPRAHTRDGGNGSSPELHALQDLAADLTGQPYILANLHGGYGAQVVDLHRRHGLGAVESAMREAAAAVGKTPHIKQIVFGAADRLDAIPRPRRRTAAELDRDAFDQEHREIKRVAADRAARRAAEGASNA